MATMFSLGLRAVRHRGPRRGRRVFFLRLLLAAVLLCGPVRPVLAADAPGQAEPSLEAVNAQNAALEAEIAKLRTLQEADPCTIRRTLTHADAASGDTALTKLESAIVLILVAGPEAGFGSGFFVAPGIVVTNHHVVGNASQVAVIGKGLTQPLMGRVIAGTEEGGRDYAVVKVETEGLAVQPLPLCPTVHKTEKVGAWGFPGAISQDDPKFKRLMDGDLTAVPEAVYSEGVVNVVHDTTPPEILHTAIISPGNSGGPLLNAAGCVVGINTAIKADDESYRQTNLSLGAGDLAAYLQSQGIQPSVSK